MEVETFENKPFDYEPSNYIQIVSDLYNLILRSLESHLTQRIYAVTAKEYRMIPWNALSPQSGEYLIDNHEISIAYRLDQEPGNNFKVGDLKLHMIAPNFEGSLKLKTDEERTRIERQVPLDAGSIEESNILHISSHGYIDSTKWEKCGILLGEYEVLTNEEITSYCLASNLVFLNICEGARSGNEHQSIVNAFHEAGANSIVGALWEVDDEMAVQISENFYYNLLKGKRMGESLRNSLLDYKNEIEEVGSLNPIQWSGYQLYGDNVRLVDGTSKAIKKISSIVLSICTSISLLFYHFGGKIRSKVLDYNLI